MSMSGGPSSTKSVTPTTFFSPASIDDQSIQEAREPRVAAVLEIGVIILLEPGADFLPRDLVIRLTKNGDHLRVAEIERITDTA